jgi:hypothetical protein
MRGHQDGRQHTGCDPLRCVMSDDSRGVGRDRACSTAWTTSRRALTATRTRCWLPSRWQRRSCRPPATCWCAPHACFGHSGPLGKRIRRSGDHHIQPITGRRGRSGHAGRAQVGAQYQLFVFLGRLTHQKGVDLIAIAAKAVLAASEVAQVRLAPALLLPSSSPPLRFLRASLYMRCRQRTPFWTLRSAPPCSVGLPMGASAIRYCHPPILFSSMCLK